MLLIVELGAWRHPTWKRRGRRLWASSFFFKGLSVPPGRAEPGILGILLGHGRSLFDLVVSRRSWHGRGPRLRRPNTTENLQRNNAVSHCVWYHTLHSRTAIFIALHRQKSFGLFIHKNQTCHRRTGGGMERCDASKRTCSQAVVHS